MPMESEDAASPTTPELSSPASDEEPEPAAGVPEPVEPTAGMLRFLEPPVKRFRLRAKTSVPADVCLPIQPSHQQLRLPTAHSEEFLSKHLWKFDLGEMERELRPKVKAPGSFNAYGSEGPRDKRSAGRRAHSPRQNEPPLGALVDPEWVDTDQPADMESFTAFSPPRKFRDEMTAARATWAQGVDRLVVNAVTYVTANVIAPYILSLQVWRTHAAGFFERLCAHRREAHSKISAAFEELRQEHSALSARVVELEARVAEAEAGLAAAHTRFRFASSSAQRGESPTARSRGRSVQERVLDAQLGAVRVRSPAPALHARQAMCEYLGHDLPDRDPPELLHVYAHAPPQQQRACTPGVVVPPQVWL